MAKCKHCRNPFAPERKGQKACSIECAQGIVQTERENAFNRKTREMKRELRENDAAYWARRAKKSCHDFIRARDGSCISCGKHLSGKYDAGHYFNSNDYPALRYDERNIHAQCPRCNSRHWKGGNLLEYRMGLVNRYGEAFVQELERLSRDASKKWTIPELKEVERYYKDKLKALDAAAKQRNNES